MPFKKQKSCVNILDLTLNAVGIGKESFRFEARTVIDRYE